MQTLSSIAYPINSNLSSQIPETSQHRQINQSQNNQNPHHTFLDKIYLSTDEPRSFVCPYTVSSILSFIHLSIYPFYPCFHVFFYHSIYLPDYVCQAGTAGKKYHLICFFFPEVDFRALDCLTVLKHLYCLDR